MLIVLFYRPFQISIHALREEGDTHRLLQRPEQHQISIHALREEGDLLTRYTRPK